MRFFAFLLILIFSLQSKTQQLENQDTIIHDIKVKLIKPESPPPDCGIFAWALAQKFEILESNFSVLETGFKIVLIQPCPEFLGNNFFIKGRIYEVKIAYISEAPFYYTVINNY